MNPNHLSIAMHHFLVVLSCSIKECRYALNAQQVERRQYCAIGMVTAALNLEAITHATYNHLTSMVINAAALRRCELIFSAKLHCRHALSIWALDEAKQKEVAA